MKAYGQEILYSNFIERLSKEVGLRSVGYRTVGASSKNQKRKARLHHAFFGPTESNFATLCRILPRGDLPTSAWSFSPKMSTSDVKGKNWGFEGKEFFSEMFCSFPVIACATRRLWTFPVAVFGILSVKKIYATTVSHLSVGKSMLLVISLCEY